MYLTLRDRPAAEKGAGRPVRQRVAGTVFLLGLVSLFTDISSESVNAILPLYLTSILGMSTLAYGFIDGIYQGVSAVVRILGGWIADRSDHPKWVAFVGYFVSALSRIALIPAHTFGAITAVITVDRLGKGVRTAPRDAMIAESSPPESLGRAFGVHRTMDTVGALLGPLLAFWILLVVPGDYRSVFIASLAFAAIGVAILLLVVPDIRPRRRQRAAAQSSVATEAADADDSELAPAPAAEPAKATIPRVSLRHLRTPLMGRLLLAAGLLGVLTIGDGFLYLELTYRDSVATKYFPLLYVGTNFAYLALAVPFGRLADRVGRARVYIGGHVLLLLAYICAGGPLAGAVTSLACLLLLGAYYAATDGVLPAIAGRLSPTGLRTSAIATAQTVVAIGRFASSILFGVMWTAYGREQALVTVSVLLLGAIPIAAMLMRGLNTPVAADADALADAA
ncbi:Major Facilitator Superfamily protein [Frankineae bacterium MT45]|nr:Major Facilitator Superfamily protein [Frankineae bacterium MT45]